MRVLKGRSEGGERWPNAALASAWALPLRPLNLPHLTVYLITNQAKLWIKILVLKDRCRIMKVLK